ncbi:MAG: hypothetical protein E6713_06030 [Sporomusaceae bacterium]|nr:hypothetical protein [Sporomusaceae bacterium]
MNQTYSDVKIVSDCPKCGSEGVAWHLKGNLLEMRCPKCYAQWKTASARCGHCFKPNGTTKPGLCPKCSFKNKYGREVK